MTILFHFSPCPENIRDEQKACLPTRQVGSRCAEVGSFWEVVRRFWEAVLRTSQPFSLIINGKVRTGNRIKKILRTAQFPPGRQVFFNHFSIALITTFVA
jgi:hypothetical protein